MSNLKFQQPKTTLSDCKTPRTERAPDRQTDEPKHAAPSHRDDVVSQTSPRADDARTRDERRRDGDD